MKLGQNTIVSPRAKLKIKITRPAIGISFIDIVLLVYLCCDDDSTRFSPPVILYLAGHNNTGSPAYNKRGLYLVYNKNRRLGMVLGHFSHKNG